MSKLQFIAIFNANFNANLPQSIKYIINLTFDALVTQLVTPNIDIFTIEEPEPPRTLYKIFCHGILIVAVGAIANGSNITYQLIANKQAKKIYITSDDLLDNFYDAICNFIKFNKINVRDKKIQIDQITLINTIIKNSQKENIQTIYSSPLFSTGDEICDAYNEGAKDMRNAIIKQLLDSANSDSANSDIVNFLQNFFKCNHA